MQGSLFTLLVRFDSTFFSSVDTGYLCWRLTGKTIDLCALQGLQVIYPKDGE